MFLKRFLCKKPLPKINPSTPSTKELADLYIGAVIETVMSSDCGKDSREIDVNAIMDRYVSNVRREYNLSPREASELRRQIQNDIEARKWIEAKQG